MILTVPCLLGLESLVAFFTIAWQAGTEWRVEFRE